MASHTMGVGGVGVHYSTEYSAPYPLARSHKRSREANKGRSQLFIQSLGDRLSLPVSVGRQCQPNLDIF